MIKIRFGIDIDGTVTRPDTLLPYLNKDFGLQLTLSDIVQYDIASIIKIDHQKMGEWFIKNEVQIYQESPLYEGAKETISSWTSIGQLFFISARKDYLLSLTKEWFYKNQIPFDHILLVGSHNKISIIKEYKIDIFLEDKHDNAVQIGEECKIPVLLFNSSYNQGNVPSNVIRVNNWVEAQRWVEQYYYDKKKKPNDVN